MPLIADGATRISDSISVVRENGQWIYFCGVQPVFQHAESDRRSFRMFTAQLICQGACRQVDIVRAFGVSKNSVIRSVDKYRAGGVNAFYTPRATRGAADLLNEYGTEEIPETKRPVVNPQWRELDRQKRSVKSKLTHRQARFAALTLHPESDEAAQAKWEKRKAELVEEIEQLERELTGITDQLKTTPSHLAWDELPATEKFQRLAPSRKQLVDTVKMIAYRAETAMASIVREELARTDDARSLLRDLFRSEADLVPDLETGPAGASPSDVEPAVQPRNRSFVGASQRRRVHLSGHQSATRLLDRRPGRNPNLVPAQNPADQEV